MAESKIVMAFSRASDAILNTKAQFIITSMTGNSNFATPTPALTVVVATRAAFDTALTGSQTKDVTKISVKNDKRQALILVLKQLGKYVALTANGNRSILLSSGFDLAKEGSEPTILGEVENFSLAEGNNTGEVVSKSDGVDNAVSYLHGYTSEPLTSDSIWVEQYSSSSNHTHKGLETGKRYWFRIKALGRNNQVSLSVALSRIAQ